MAQRHEEETTEFKVETLILCINNCGFSGNPSTKNMCQNCYKASTNVGIIPPLAFSGSQETTTTTTKPRSTSSVVRLQTERSENRRDLTMSTTTAATMMMTKTEEEKKERSENRRDLTISTTTAMMMRKTEKEGSSSSNSTEKRRAPEVNRCSGCRRKVGLTGFRCRCGDLFCSEHRYSDRHVCSYDYKAAGRDAIARENPVVKAAKIVRV